MNTSPYNFILSPVRTFFSRVLFFFSIIFLFIGVFQSFSSVILQEERGVLFIVDTSLSMSVEDIMGSGGTLLSRLDVAKEILLAYRGTLPRALMTFAGDVHLQFPLSHDVSLWRTRVEMLTPRTYGSQTDIAQSLASVGLIYPKRALDIIIMTDGEDTVGTILQKKNTLPAGTHLTVVGIGTSKGAQIISYYDGEGKAQYKKYNGKDIVSQLDQSYLKNLSEIYDARLFLVENVGYLDTLFASIFDQIGEKSQTNIPSIFMILGSILFISAILLPNYIHK